MAVSNPLPPPTYPTPPSGSLPGAGNLGGFCIPQLAGWWPWLLALILIGIGFLVWFHKLPLPPKSAKWFWIIGIILLLLWWLWGTC